MKPRLLPRSSSRPARLLALRSAERWTRRSAGPASSRGRSSEARWAAGRAVRRRPALRARAIDRGRRSRACSSTSSATGRERVASASVRMRSRISRSCSIARSSTTTASREGRMRAAARSRRRARARAGIVAEFARGERRALETLFRRLRRDPHDPPRSVRDELERAIARILRRVDPVPGEEPTPGNLPHGPGDGFTR